MGTRPSLTLILVIAWAVAPGVVRAQDMMDQVNLSSPTFTEAEMTREDVAILLDADQAPDLSLRRLNGLDLSGLDFSGANLRGAYLNKAKLSGANFDGAILDQAWGAGQRLVQGQPQRAHPCSPPRCAVRIAPAPTCRRPASPAT